MQAGNAAVSRMLAVQREGPAQTAATTAVTQSAAPAAQLQIQAHEVTPTAAGGGATPPGGTTSTTAPTGQSATAASTPPAGSGGAPAQKQFQVQYAFQGQATQAAGQPNQISGAHQITAQLDVSHHDDEHAGREESYAVQGSVDAASGHFTGAVFQVQEALVTATRHHLQAQIFGNASVGAGADASGVLRPVAQAGIGVQGNIVINDRVSVFLAAQDQASLMFGPRGAAVSNSEQVSAGITITIP
jgi:hypothetical protein